MKKTLMLTNLLLAMVSVGSFRDASMAVTSQSEIDSEEKITINFERVSCPTGCPAFSIKIRPDRSVEYEGRVFARVTGSDSRINTSRNTSKASRLIPITSEFGCEARHLRSTEFGPSSTSYLSPIFRVRE